MVQQFECGCGHIFSPTRVGENIKFKKGFEWKFYDNASEIMPDSLKVRKRIFRRDEETVLSRIVNIKTTYVARRNFMERSFECELCGEPYVIRDFVEPRERGRGLSHLFVVKVIEERGHYRRGPRPTTLYFS